MKTSAEILSTLGTINSDFRLIFARHRALVRRREILSTELVTEIGTVKGGEDLFNPSPASALAIVLSDRGRELASLAAFISAIESSEIFKSANSVLVPIIDELDDAREREAAAAAELASAEHKLNEATAAARAEAEPLVAQSIAQNAAVKQALAQVRRLGKPMGELP